MRASYRGIATVAATLALAAGIAAAIKRGPPDFAAITPIAMVRDVADHPQWAIRLAPAAHQIASDSVGVTLPPAGRAYQLWLVTPEGPRSLGLLPTSGRKVTAEMPWLVSRLAGAGELLVSLEPARGSEHLQPSGPILFRTAYSDKSRG